ncbi:Na+/H+ antiporter subunit G [Sphingobacterium mizutaii NBRC 14946 = DSM 11724]|uniref:Multiple resistance and pH homeostasis protein G n=2 Tax=Sphingobacterium mizutaii TaxID=1010 RepID=A0AAJ4X8Q0_9SPHI|nr:monovalent cation/H(+) antiporter subunit G [Sphingobacterium mizutaii]GEM67724.1 Na+/H+ antiporter subunit G [Sphingobacterium mizutaii NBRC 14946 = DSM 11724]SDL70390.1 multisubunit sodium/proton antiporter, MrpG subunit [Sphingobacterium mizutaii]SNV41847.1 Multiple resistance and pH homeostasis protein G [Sphingobacterium mizutaii]
MIDIILAILSTVGALSILFASIGVLRMPDFYLRLSVTVKASTLGVGLLLICAAIMFPEDVSVTTKSIAIIFFLLLTAPIAAHMIGKAAYFIGIPLWKGTVIDELKGMYNKETHCLESDPKKADQNAPDNIAHTDDATD